jgi:hypothetical protein
MRRSESTPAGSRAVVRNQCLSGPLPCRRPCWPSPMPSTRKYHALVILAAWCSLRFGELAGLRRSRIDLLHRQIHVQEQVIKLTGGKVMFKAPKSDSGRTVDIPAELVPLLTDHLADHVGPAADALVFTSPEGRPLRRIKFRPRWAEACKCAGVSGLHFHDLRGSGCNLGSHRRGDSPGVDAPSRPSNTHCRTPLPALELRPSPGGGGSPQGTPVPGCSRVGTGRRGGRNQGIKIVPVRSRYST